MHCSLNRIAQGVLKHWFDEFQIACAKSETILQKKKTVEVASTRIILGTEELEFDQLRICAESRAERDMSVKHSDSSFSLASQLVSRPVDVLVAAKVSTAVMLCD